MNYPYENYEASFDAMPIDGEYIFDDNPLSVRDAINRTSRKIPQTALLRQKRRLRSPFSSNAVDMLRSQPSKLRASRRSPDRAEAKLSSETTGAYYQ